MIVHLFCAAFSVVKGQQKALNIPGIHQLVSDSRTENEKQQLALERQRINSVNEQVNRTLLARLNATCRNIQDRFNFIGTLLSASEIGVRAIPLVSAISADQLVLVQMAQKDPLLLLLVSRAETDFAVHSRDLLSYLVGLSLSIGTVNQMKISDRKILFDFVLSELSRMREISGGLIIIVKNSGRTGLIDRLDPFADYINTDRSIIKDILKNAKYLNQ